MFALGALAVLVVVAVAAALVLTRVGAGRMRRLYEEEKEALLRQGRAATPTAVDAAAVAALPPPLQNYLRAAGAVGRPGLRVVELRQSGGLRSGRDQPWMPFESEQAYSASPPGFVWLARAQAAPLFEIVARDKYADGRGNMLVRLLGTFTVADGRGPEMDQGAALRHWGEIIAFPETVLAPQLRWEPMDERKARLLVRDGALQLEATVEFGADGFPTAFHAMRFRDAPGGSVLTPWTGHSTDWRVIDGRLFPSHWESVWHLPDGDFVAVRMDIRAIRTE